MSDDIAQIPDDELRAALHGSRAANDYLREQLTAERDRSSDFVNALCALIPDDRDDDVAAEAIVIGWVKELLAEVRQLTEARDRARALAQQWVDDMPENVTESAVRVVLADAGQQILAALNGGED